MARAGRIGLSANYLNFNELGDGPLLESLAHRAEVFGRTHRVPMDAAMTADLNGTPLAYARALAKAGVKTLLTFVHPHHGYPPLGKRQHLVQWDLGDGQSIAVCLADHYHTGNELGLAPNAAWNYTAGFSDPIGNDDSDLLDRRLPTYLRRLTESGWEHEFAVIAVSGLATDNGPPAIAIADRIARWNEKHGHEIRIEMSTPSRVGQAIAAVTQLPVIRGDWPDWWADGAAGDPEGAALFRHAQRERRWLVDLARHRPECTVDLESLDRTLALYVEHTFGHSASVSVPWYLLAQQLRLCKLGYAGDAADRAEALVDQVAETLGGGALAYDRPAAFRVINAGSRTVKDLVELEIEGCELAKLGLLDTPVRITRADNDEVLTHQSMTSLRGAKWAVELSLNPGQVLDVHIAADPSPPASTRIPIEVPDRVGDVPGDDSDIPPTSIRNDQVEISWQAGRGITRWFDVAGGHDMIVPRTSDAPAPFTLRASRLAGAMDGTVQCLNRRHLGRNRNSPSATWCTSRLLRAKRLAAGPLMDIVELEYAMDGFEFVRLWLSAWRFQSRVDVELACYKIGTWDIENVYLALPFGTGSDGGDLWLDRAGIPHRPNKPDAQIPGSLTDYYGVQDGLGWTAANHGVAVTMWDSHLIQTGPLDFRQRRLFGDPAASAADVHAWLMTNYWETNFSPDLAGFYSFRYAIFWGEALATAEEGLQTCRETTVGLRAIRLRS